MPQKIWTAEELEQMTPAERQALFYASIVRDLDEVAISSTAPSDASCPVTTNALTNIPEPMKTR